MVPAQRSGVPRFVLSGPPIGCGAWESARARGPAAQRCIKGPPAPGRRHCLRPPLSSPSGARDSRGASPAPIWERDAGHMEVALSPLSTAPAWLVVEAGLSPGLGGRAP